jgi:hypothetical protein
MSGQPQLMVMFYLLDRLRIIKVRDETTVGDGNPMIIPLESSMHLR